MSKAQKDTKKEPNDIRIGMRTRPRNVIKYSTSVMDELKLTELKFSAVGGSIGRLLDIVEVLKVLKPGLYQQNRITSVAYQTVDSNNKLLTQKLYPKLEVVLSKEEPKNKTEGYQGQMDENERKQIESIMNKKKKKEKKTKERGGGLREEEEELEEGDLEEEDEEEGLGEDPEEVEGELQERVREEEEQQEEVVIEDKEDQLPLEEIREEVQVVKYY